MASRQELTRATELALAGDWAGAHAIVQAHEDDATANWIHAVLHKIEGDEGNARYWYRRTSGQAFEAFGDARAELRAIQASLTY
jgi:phosphodiesterase/alkaline phosphatase D-like protein